MKRPSREGFRRYLLGTRKAATPCSMRHCVLANYMRTLDPRAYLETMTWRVHGQIRDLPNWADRVMSRFDRLGEGGPWNCAPVPARTYRKLVLGVL